ncbi:hypothetical protein [Jiella marina]|uniref:hypothetical protein n=1 Tax=Jiella sp. LLJ827 TaxID=2917712 RepID=UPI002100C6FF|nr:hypothetical protein [Jiella sp. LLJ827]MCQ0986388.1 hypothetical protein [Jiella sp. LLJ827]
MFRFRLVAALAACVAVSQIAAAQDFDTPALAPVVDDRTPNYDLPMPNVKNNTARTDVPRLRSAIHAIDAELAAQDINVPATLAAAFEGLAEALTSTVPATVGDLWFNGGILSVVPEGGGRPKPEFGRVVVPGGLPQFVDLAQPPYRTLGEATPDTVAFGAGNAIVYCPNLGCIKDDADWTHMATSALIMSETRLGPVAEENTLSVSTRISTGARKVWTADTVYEVGDYFAASGDSPTYEVISCTGDCESGATAPTSEKGDPDETNGDLVVRWVNPPALSAKTSIYNDVEVIGADASGSAWANVHNMRFTGGVQKIFMVNTELDFDNQSGDCVIGTSNCIVLYITPKGDTSTAALTIQTKGNKNKIWQDSPTNSVPGKPALHWGMRFTGVADTLLADRDVLNFEVGNADNAIGFNTFNAAGTFSFDEAVIKNRATAPVIFHNLGNGTTAAFRDESASALGFYATGVKSGADARLGSSAPTGLHVLGTKGSYGIREQSTAPIGLKLDGLYSSKQVEGAGWDVSPAGALTANALTANSFLKLGGFTVATLPTCDASRRNEIRVANDLTSPTAGGSLTGSGTDRRPVFCGNSGWVSMF